MLEYLEKKRRKEEKELRKFSEKLILETNAANNHNKTDGIFTRRIDHR